MNGPATPSANGPADAGQAAAEALYASLRRVLDNVTDGIAIHRKGVVVYANQRAAQLVGYDRASELLGHSTLEFVHPDYRPIVARRIRDSYERAVVTSEIEERFLRRDGSELPVQVITVPVVFEGAPATLVHVRDLTVQKWLESQLRASDRLAGIGRVASGIAHEINNPLTYVMANLDLATRAAERIAESADGSEVRELRGALAGALEGAEHVRRIVRDVKRFSRDGAAGIGPVDVRAVIESCARMAAVEMRDRAHLTLRLDEAAPVLGSESRLAEVFLNLILNAVEAIPPGSPDSNEVRIVARRGAHNEVIVDVRDTGVGMTPEIRARMFEPFFTSKREGTGLGLSIVDAIVTSLGGRIHVETEPGSGTCVGVTLRGAASSDAGTARAHAPVELPDCRVLVVDHVPTVGAMLRQALPAHDVVSAITASAALDTLASDTSFDALLFDAELTDRSAYELWFEVKQRHPGLERRIIFMMPSITAPALVDPITRLPNRRIDKPFRLDELCELLTTTVRDGGRTQGAAPLSA